MKEVVFSYNLTEHDFDVKKEIIPGRDANHLMKADALIKTIKNDVKGCLTKKERWKYGFLFEGKIAFFISDIQLNNLAIKHFCDFTEQVGAKKCVVYYESTIDKADILHSAKTFLATNPESEAIGAAGNKERYYKILDNSIELGEIRRVK